MTDGPSSALTDSASLYDTGPSQETLDFANPYVNSGPSADTLAFAQPEMNGGESGGITDMLGKLMSAQSGGPVTGAYDGQGLVHKGVTTAAGAAAPFTYGASLAAPPILAGIESLLGINDQDPLPDVQLPSDPRLVAEPLIKKQDSGLSSMVPNIGGGALERMMQTQLYRRT